MIKGENGRNKEKGRGFGISIFRFRRFWEIKMVVVIEEFFFLKFFSFLWEDVIFLYIFFYFNIL